MILISLTSTVRVCGLNGVSTKSGGKYGFVRWNRVKENLNLISQNFGKELIILNIDEIKKETEFIKATNKMESSLLDSPIKPDDYFIESTYQIHRCCKITRIQKIK